MLVIVFALCFILVYALPAESPCDDDTYILDRDLFPPEVRERCEKPGQNMPPPIMIKKN